MNVFAQLSLVFAYVAIVMGTLVIIRNNRDSVHRLFFLFCAGAFYWCFVEYGMRHASGMAEAQVWSKAFSFWPMPEVFMLHFVLLYSGIMKPGWRFGPLFLLYAPALAFSLLDLFTMRISSEPVLMAWGWTYGMPHTWEKSASVIWACIVTTASVGVCVWFVCAASITRRRKQGLFILCGFLIIVAAGYSTDVASFLLKRRIPEMSSLGFALGAVFIGYAIFRYNLFNLAPAAAAQEIIDTIRDILLLIDDSGTIVSANRAATALLGYSADELVGRPLEFIVALENRDSVKSLVDGRNSRPGDDYIEISLMTKQASAVLFSVSTSVVRDRQGIYQGTVFIGRDISGYKLLQEKLFLAKQEEERAKDVRQANDAMLNLLEDLKTENKLREASENDLRQSEDKFATAFRISSYAITITHVEDGKFVDVNDGFTSIAGYTREEALADSSIGMKLWINEEDRQEVMSVLRAGRIVNSREYQFRTKSGTVITGLFSAQTIKLSSGPCILSSIKDITARKRMEDQLQKTNQDLDTLMSNLYSGILSTSKDGEVEHVNQAFCDLFNLSAAPDDLRGLSSSDMLKNVAGAYAAPAVTLARIQELIARGKPVKGEEIAMRDGRFLMVDYIPIVDKDGKECGRIWHHLDISERKRAEDEIRTAKAFLDNIINTIADPVFVKDENRRFVLVNDALCTIVGRTRENLLGEDGDDMFPPEQVEIFRRMDANVLDSGEDNINEEALSNLLSGDVQTIVTRKTRYIDPSGNRFLVGVIRDITDRVRASEDNARLEEQLRQTQKIESIGRLAGGVAHDFNNMLSVILGYGEDLVEHLHPQDPLREQATQIVKAGQRSAALTRQLLAFSRRQTLQAEVLDLNALIENIEPMLRRMIGEDIEIKLPLAKDLACVIADPGQIEQIIINLVSNARDAMPKGGTLVIETANVELDESYAKNHPCAVPGKYSSLALTDTGCGMDQETMAQIFEPFFTTKEKGKGTGLGLSTVYGIVKQSGGYIKADSTLGQGTIFTIFLPQTTAQPKKKEDSAEGQPHIGRGEHILLVEDEESLRTLLTKSLLELNYQVSVAANGDEALHLVKSRNFKPDLVITDVVMPGMSGSVLADQLRLIFPGLNVLYMSGYADDAIVHHGVLDPSLPFIQKPFSAHALATKISEVLRGGGTPKSLGKNILMIDDDAQFRELVRRFCTRGGHEFVGVDSSQKALEALAGQSVDVLLVDMNIPGTDGKRILAQIRAAGFTMPAIMISGDVQSIPMDDLRPLGAVGALEKSGDGKPLLQLIDEIVEKTPDYSPQKNA